MSATVLIVIGVFAGTGFLLGMLATHAALRRRERRLARDLARLHAATRTLRFGPGP